MNLGLKTFIFPAALIILSSSCASIVSKSNWPVSFDSEPQKAKVTVKDKKGNVVFDGRTPSAVKLKSGNGFFSKASYTVLFHLDGFQDKTVPLNCTINGWYFGNILIGGVIGMLIVDPITGAMWKLDKDYVYEKLEPAAGSNASLQLIDISNVSPEMKRHLVKIR